MRYDREPWRKLYVSESVEDRMRPLLARGLRDYLLRHAKDDGTILPKTSDPGGDLARALGAHDGERDTVARYVQDWIDDGFLALRRDALVIRNFARAQKARSKGAERQKRYRSKKKGEDGVTRDATSDVTNDVTVTGPVTPSRAPARISSHLISSSASAPEGEAGEPDPTTPHALAYNWKPWPTTLAALEMNHGMPTWAAEAIANRFTLHFALDASARATAVGWQQRFAKWAAKDWSDPEKRPQKPEEPDPDVLRARAARDAMDRAEARQRGAGGQQTAFPDPAKAAAVKAALARVGT